MIKIVIYGTGGVGGYFGTRLVQSGAEVSFIARGAHLEAMHKHGLQLKSIGGDYHVSQVQAYDKMQHLQGQQIDLVVLAVKSWQLEAACKDIQPAIGHDTVVLPLLNGISNIELVSQVIEPKQVLGGLCRIISMIASPGVIDHVALQPSIVFGELNNQQTHRVLAIQKLFEKAQIHSKIADDIQAEIWTKFMFITMVSGIGALTRAPIGVMRLSSYIRNLMRETAQEIFALAQKKGIKLKEGLIEKQFKIIDAQPAHTTASLQRDIMEGKPSELEAQNGIVVKLGKELGVSTPVNSFIYHCLWPQETQARM